MRILYSIYICILSELSLPLKYSLHLTSVCSVSRCPSEDLNEVLADESLASDGFAIVIVEIVIGDPLENANVTAVALQLATQLV